MIGPERGIADRFWRTEKVQKPERNKRIAERANQARLILRNSLRRRGAGECETLHPVTLTPVTLDRPLTKRMRTSRPLLLHLRFAQWLRACLTFLLTVSLNFQPVSQLPSIPFCY